MFPWYVWLVWYSTTFVGIAVLIRGAWTRQFVRYPFFYCQLSSILILALCSHYLVLFDRPFYTLWYWYTQLLTMAASIVGNALEVLRHVFTESPAARFAAGIRRALFIVATAYVAVALYVLQRARPSVVLLERDFRTVQVLIWLVVLCGVFYFGLPLGRNIKGIFLGYGAYIAGSLVSLTLRCRFPTALVSVTNFFQLFFLLVGYLIYFFGLWSYTPPPVPAHPIPPAFVSRIDPREMWRLARVRLFKTT